MGEGDNGRPKMPPPDKRRIITDLGQLPPAMGGPAIPGGPPGPPPGGPSVRSAPVDTSKPPITILGTFYVPPGIPDDTAPAGVFWPMPDGGLALSPFAAPARQVTGGPPPDGELPSDGELPPESANEVLDEDERSEHQAPAVFTEDET